MFTHIGNLYLKIVRWAHLDVLEEVQPKYDSLKK